ncbi:MAG: oligosaccharide flippase family protein [Vicingus serpentipes]|nr:oligosaccharide flippase family protein [Vicingus serpentipes]
MINKSKFSIDSLFNLFSVGISGALYILINTIIIHYYGEDVLGVFNQSYAVYIIIAQIAAFGIHLSVQQYIPRFFKNKEKVDEVMTSSLVLVLITATIITLSCYPFTNLVASFFDSKDVNQGLYSCLWGIVFFSLNKVLLAYINGVRRMKSFALFTFLRFFLMFTTLCCLIFFVDDSSLITTIFAIPELILFLILIIYTSKFFTFKFNSSSLSFIKEHFNFGRNAFIGNLLLDINTRVDVIMLGYFTTDQNVGIYSFVLAIAEGILQIPVVFRNNINPIITKASVMKNVSKQFNILLKKNIISFYKIIGGLALLTIVLYPFGLFVLGIKDYFMTYWILYAILVAAIVLSSGYLPLTMMFNQMKLPHIQSLLFLILFVVNVIGNFIFIQWIGLYGAAIGTALSYIAQMIFIKLFARKYCNLHI